MEEWAPPGAGQASTSWRVIHISMCSCRVGDTEVGAALLVPVAR